MNTVQHWQATLGIDGEADRITTIGDDIVEIGLLDQGPTKAPQTGLGVIEVSGPDACDFLHAQLTADCRKLQPGHSLLAAWCSPKGRVLYLLRLIRNEDSFIILVPDEQCDALIKRLSMFVLRAQVVLTNQSADYTVIQCNGDFAAPASGDVFVGRDRTQTWFVVPFSGLGQTWQAIPAQAVGEAALMLQDIRLGIAHLPVSLSDTFLPQELNLDISDGVSFEKGCYPGQEIVARVKFRGEVKRRLARLLGQTTDRPVPGTRIVTRDGEPLGTVLLAETTGEQQVEILAVLNRAADTVFLSGADADALSRGAMIYELGE